MNHRWRSFYRFRSCTIIINISNQAPYKTYSYQRNTAEKTAKTVISTAISMALLLLLHLFLEYSLSAFDETNIMTWHFVIIHDLRLIVVGLVVIRAIWIGLLWSNALHLIKHDFNLKEQKMKPKNENKNTKRNRTQNYETLRVYVYRETLCVHRPSNSSNSNVTEKESFFLLLSYTQKRKEANKIGNNNTTKTIYSNDIKSKKTMNIVYTKRKKNKTRLFIFILCSRH